jgi:hypothetical protein
LSGLPGGRFDALPQADTRGTLKLHPETLASASENATALKATSGSSDGLEHFPAKWIPGSRRENATEQGIRGPFRFNRNGKCARRRPRPCSGATFPPGSSFPADRGSPCPDNHFGIRLGQRNRAKDLLAYLLDNLAALARRLRDGAMGFAGLWGLRKGRDFSARTREHDDGCKKTEQPATENAAYR